jgi:hypothetical protein
VCERSRDMEIERRYLLFIGVVREVQTVSYVDTTCLQIKVCGSSSARCPFLTRPTNCCQLSSILQYVSGGLARRQGKLTGVLNLY